MHTVPIGVIDGIWPSHWEDTGAADQLLWIVFLVGGGVLVLAGLRLFGRSPWGAAALVSVGSARGSPADLLDGRRLLVAIALAVLSIVYARRSAATA